MRRLPQLNRLMCSPPKLGKPLCSFASPEDNRTIEEFLECINATLKKRELPELEARILEDGLLELGCLNCILFEEGRPIFRPSIGGKDVGIQRDESLELSYSPQAQLIMLGLLYEADMLP